MIIDPGIEVQYPGSVSIEPIGNDFFYQMFERLQQTYFQEDIYGKSASI